MDATAPGQPVPLDDDAPFEVETEFTGDCARLALRGELDSATVGVLDDELRLVWSRDSRSIEIDLRGLTFVGSAGISAFLEVNARAREAGRSLTLVRGSEWVHRIFELTGIEGEFAFRPGTVFGGGSLDRG
jgi:anti-sigma B factor antagonist